MSDELRTERAQAELTPEKEAEIERDLADLANLDMYRRLNQAQAEALIHIASVLPEPHMGTGDPRDLAREVERQFGQRSMGKAPRCTICGASRIFDKRGRPGACSLVPGRDGTGGCPDPLHDARAEQRGTSKAQPGVGDEVIITNEAESPHQRGCSGRVKSTRDDQAFVILDPGGGAFAGLRGVGFWFPMVHLRTVVARRLEGAQSACPYGRVQCTDGRAPCDQHPERAEPNAGHTGSFAPSDDPATRRQLTQILAIERAKKELAPARNCCVSNGETPGRRCSDCPNREEKP